MHVKNYFFIAERSDKVEGKAPHHAVVAKLRQMMSNAAIDVI